MLLFVFFRLFLENFENSARNKTLVQTKTFFEPFKKSSRLVVCQTNSYKHCAFFHFPAKKFFEFLFFRCVFRCASK